MQGSGLNSQLEATNPKLQAGAYEQVSRSLLLRSNPSLVELAPEQ